jgi:hypothetical protein
MLEHTSAKLLTLPAKLQPRPTFKLKVIWQFLQKLGSVLIDSFCSGYEYIPDSESASITAGPSGTWEDATGPSGSEDDLLSDKPSVRSKTGKKLRKFQPQESKDDDTVKDSGTAPRFVTLLRKKTEVGDGQSARYSKFKKN